MYKGLLQAVVLAGIIMPANAQNIARPDVPENIKAPGGEEVVLEAHASGMQIYACQQDSNGRYAWMLKGPEAELRDSGGAIIGRHSVGPTWTLNDGSEVTGKPVAQVDSPDADSIPWLLVSVDHNSGDGLLRGVAHVQRIHTNGGEPPPKTDCNASGQNREASSSYTADYYFYARGNNH